MAVTTTPLGFKKPDGNELVRGGDNVIADNAQKAEELIQADRAAATGLAARVTTAENTVTTHSTRLGTVETKVTTAQADIDLAEAQICTTQATVTTHGTRIGSFESQIAGLSAQVAAVSTPFNIGIDLDGVPFYSDGASGLALEADTDGVPYFL